MQGLVQSVILTVRYNIIVEIHFKHKSSLHNIDRKLITVQLTLVSVELILMS
jgi:hypothetical protein